MEWQTLGAAALRHMLTTAAGSLAAHGLIMGDQKEQFISAAMFLAGLGWSIWQKYGQSAVQEELNWLKSRGVPTATIKQAMDQKAAGQSNKNS